ncbi:MAG TPA: Na/Pi symporter, partial [Gemmatales bacterium]|nr:Na/Pi symporter [Gemmatales bacterium]
ALEQMTNATSPLRSYQPFLQLMSQLESPFLGIVAGTVFTALVQSSSATTGVILALASQGLMTLPAALAVALGANLGSCATALLASLGKPAEARQAAIVHVIFNGIGVFLWAFFLPQLASLVTHLSQDLPRQVAHAHTLFNVFNTLLLIWFAGPMARAAQWLVPSPPSALNEAVPETPVYLDKDLLKTPALALDRVRMEIGNMGTDVLKMFENASNSVLHGTRQQLEKTAAMDQEVNARYRAVVDYTRHLSRNEMTLSDTQTLEACLSAVNYLESAGDIISSNWITQGFRRLEHQLRLGQDVEKKFTELQKYVAGHLNHAIIAFVEKNVDMAEQVLKSKAEFQMLSQNLQEYLRQGLLLQDTKQVRLFQMEIDLISQLQRLHYLARRLAKLSLKSEAKAA